jgi:hypothetical protein
LGFIDDIFFRLDQREIKTCLGNGVGNSEVDFGLLFEPLDDLSGHVVAGEALVAF